jgi:hypothetical protein
MIPARVRVSWEHLTNGRRLTTQTLIFSPFSHFNAVRRLTHVEVFRLPLEVAARRRGDVWRVLSWAAHFTYSIHDRSQNCSPNAKNGRCQCV